MRKKAIVAIAACVLLVLSGSAVFAAGTADTGGERTISFYSGSPGGGWYPIAVAIADVWDKNIDGLTFTHADAGGAGNLVAIEAGKADVAITTTASIGDAVMGNAPFEAATKKVLAIAAFSPEYYTLWVWKDSGIEKVSDLKGKRLVPLPRGYTTEVLTRKLLAAAGLSYDDMAKIDHVDLSEGVSLMKDGHTDAMANAFMFKGDPNITELSIYRPVRALPIEGEIQKKLIEGNPGLAPAMLPAGSYPGIDKDVPVLGFGLALAVSSELPEDLVYNMTKSMVESWEDLKLVSESLAHVELPELASPYVGTQYHPGAAKYYQERGWMD
jgi:TRAP transporter TAXI family solute receptor